MCNIFLDVARPNETWSLNFTQLLKQTGMEKPASRALLCSHAHTSERCCCSGQVSDTNHKDTQPNFKSEIVQV